MTDSNYTDTKNQLLIEAEDVAACYAALGDLARLEGAVALSDGLNALKRAVEVYEVRVFGVRLEEFVDSD